MNNDITFKDVLNNYINILNCSAKELAIISNVQESVISRYRNGEIEPKQKNKQVENIINGIVKLAKEKNIKNITVQNVTNDFEATIKDINFEGVRHKLNLLIETLDINASDISRYLNYDTSHFYRIRHGERKPAHIYDFICDISNYVEKKHFDDLSKNKIKEIIGLENNKFQINEEIKRWLSSNKELQEDNNKIDSFLKELDDFNLDDYIKVIHFDELKVPKVPYTLPKSKFYYGLNEMKQGEIDFLKGTVISKNKDDVFMWSDMQMDDMTEDLEFNKKWMFGVAMMIKKGLHLNVIHNLDRPFKELIIGLEGWIPIYMTGQVSPYYMKNYSDRIHSHLSYISGSYALTGECIVGYHSKGKYYLTNNKKELLYYQDKAKIMLKKASPLMDIYTNNNVDELMDFYKEDVKTSGKRIRILSSLPFHSLDEELLIEISKNNNLSDKHIEILKSSLKKEKNYIKEISKNNIFIDEINNLDESYFKTNTFSINLSKYIPDLELEYSYEEYLKHLEKTKLLESKNYKLKINDNQVFKNIDIYINEDKYVVISKNNNPNIHFIISHEKLVNAIQKFKPLIVEEN